MKKTFFLAILFIASGAGANQDSKSWALAQLKFEDTRIDLSSCGSSGGTYAFTRPTATTLLTCEGKIVGTDTTVLLIQAGGKNSYYSVDTCAQQTGFAAQEGGDTKQKCAVQALDVASLKAVGKKGVITFHTTWEYSDGSTQFSFKMNGQAISGILVDFDTLKNDQSL